MSVDRAAKWAGMSTPEKMRALRLLDDSASEALDRLGGFLNWAMVEYEGKNLPDDPPGEYLDAVYSQEWINRKDES